MVDSVKVWRIDLDAEQAADDTLAALLDADARHRVARFVRAADRRRFLVSHAAVRRILAQECGVPPSALVFERSSFGKPRLIGSDVDLQFSLSHSVGCAMVAIARHQEIGVDVEAIRSREDLDGLARLIMTAHEWMDWRELSGDDARQNAFHVCWTRKEAVLKAAGTGLHVEPTTVETGFGRGNGTLVRHPNGTSWVVMDIQVGSGFAGAIAMHTVLPIEHAVLPPLFAV